MIEMMTFDLRTQVGTDTFRATDHEMQTEFAYGQPGLVRRTVARGEAGDWVVITLWRSAADADAANERAADDRFARRLSDLIDSGSVQLRRYWELDE